MKILLFLAFIASLGMSKTTTDQKLIDGFENASDSISIEFFKPYFYAPGTLCSLKDEYGQFMRVVFDRHTLQQDDSGPLYEDDEVDLEKIVLKSIGPYKFIGLAPLYVQMHESETEITMITEGAIGALSTRRYGTRFRQSGKYVFFNFKTMESDLINYYGYCW